MPPLRPPQMLHEHVLALKPPLTMTTSANGHLWAHAWPKVLVPALQKFMTAAAYAEAKAEVRKSRWNHALRCVHGHRDAAATATSTVSPCRRCFHRPTAKCRRRRPHRSHRVPSPSRAAAYARARNRCHQAHAIRRPLAHSRCPHSRPSEQRLGSKALSVATSGGTRRRPSSAHREPRTGGAGGVTICPMHIMCQSIRLQCSAPSASQRISGWFYMVELPRSPPTSTADDLSPSMTRSPYP